MASALALSLSLLSAACGPNRTVPPRPIWDGDAGVPVPLGCVPNLDGRIEATELMPAYDVGASFLLSPSGELRDVLTAGEVRPDGTLRWDLGTDYASDVAVRFSAQHVEGTWFASSFPSGQFAVSDDPSGALLGVYRLDTTGLYLLGFASRDMSPPEGQTLWVYETPIVVFQLPLVPGASWVTVSDVRNATVRGLPYAGRDTYETHVSGSAGELVLPDLSFTQAMRVSTHVTIEPSAGAAIQRRQSSWLFECFGEVARVIAPEGEASDDFTTAASMRRFGL
ncbi:MAG: hypothetical protein K1X94_06525 [Sandaracinaceae bacterium]|nr:hypothetical protein [Sandaracinaceae bacterium]